MDKLIQTFKSRTMLVSYALIILGAVEAHFSLVAGFIPAAYHPVAISLIGLLMAVLRLVTTKPVADK